MLRVALVITELEVGGAERCLTNLALGLDRARFAPVVYSLGPRPRDERAALVRQLEAAGVPIHFLGLTHASQFFRGVRRLAELLRAQRADVVQTFLFHANVLGTRAAKQAGIEHVCTGIRVADPRWTRGLVERIATRRASRFVCVSQGVADQCRQRGFDAQKLVVIPNGIDLERWKNAQPADLTQFGVRPGRPVMVYVGRLDRQKQLHRLMMIADEFYAAEFLVVGDGPDRELNERVAKRMSLDYVHFAGWQADVPGILAASDVLVLFSRWEGMPNVILEAMAAGKPVLTTPVEGAEELLGGGFAEQTATKDFPWRLLQVLDNSSLRKDLGRRNQLQAEQFSLPRMVGRYAELYESLVGGDK
jgi:glycosyltransferase involved in cell wall biosynthesis